MKHFQEHTQGGLVYATSPLLSCPHAFTTRLGGVSRGHLSSLNLGENRGDAPENVKENYARLCAALGMPAHRMVFSRQVHGVQVRIVTEADIHRLFDPIPYEADALVTDCRELVLTIFVADCVPVLLLEPEAGVIAAVHCGWRSSVGDILGNTLTAMESLGARPEKLRAAIGPSIGACCFETGSDVTEALRRYIGPEAEVCIREKPDRADKYLVDLRRANLLRLRQLGLPEENISLSEECTMCKSDKYWSHRATKGLRGSQAGLIML